MNISKILNETQKKALEEAHIKVEDKILTEHERVEFFKSLFHTSISTRVLDDIYDTLYLWSINNESLTGKKS